MLPREYFAVLAVLLLPGNTKIYRYGIVHSPTAVMTAKYYPLEKAITRFVTGYGGTSYSDPYQGPALAKAPRETAIEELKKMAQRHPAFVELGRGSIVEIVIDLTGTQLRAA